MNDAPETLRDLVGAYLAEQCTVIIEAEPALRAGENVVHVTRVAVRRLRSTLRVFGELFDVAQAGHLEDELVWWAGLLGAVRDLDILQAGLTGQIAALPPELVLGSVESTIQTEIAASRKVGMDAVLAGDGLRALPQAGRAGARLAERPARSPPAADVPADEGQGLRQAGREEGEQAAGGCGGRPGGRRGRRRRAVPLRPQGGQAAPVRGRGGAAAVGRQGREDRGRPQGPAGHPRPPPGPGGQRRLPARPRFPPRRPLGSQRLHLRPALRPGGRPRATPWSPTSSPFL